MPVRVADRHGHIEVCGDDGVHIHAVGEPDECILGHAEQRPEELVRSALDRVCARTVLAGAVAQRVGYALRPAPRFAACLVTHPSVARIAWLCSVPHRVWWLCSKEGILSWRRRRRWWWRWAGTAATPPSSERAWHLERIVILDHLIRCFESTLLSCSVEQHFFPKSGFDLDPSQALFCAQSRPRRSILVKVVCDGCVTHALLLCRFSVVQLLSDGSEDVHPPEPTHGVHVVSTPNFF